MTSSCRARSRRTHTRRTRTKGEQSGSVAVEFALLFPLMLTLAVGTLEFGRVFIANSHLTTAARLGARTGVVRGTTTADVNDAISTYLTDTFVGDGYTTSVTGVGFGLDTDTQVVVSVSYDLPLLSGLDLPGTENGSIPLEATVTMRHQ